MATLGVLLLGYVNWLCFNQPPPEPGTIAGRYSIFISDDGAYTLAPVEMLQTGGMSIDPFSDRLTASLGGESFLQALVLAVLPVDYVHLADPGLAFLGMGVLLLTIRRLKRAARLALTLVFATYPCSIINASAAVVPVFLLLALARTLYQVRSGNPIGASMAAAVLLAAIVTLKTTLISIVLLFVFSWEVLLALMTRRLRPIALGAMIGILSFVMVLPYMVRSYQASKTLLYPYLGEGYRKHTLALLPNKTAFSSTSRPRLSEKIRDVVPKPQSLFLLAGCGTAVWCTLRWRTSIKRRALVLACCTAGLVNLVATISVFESAEFWRYGYVARCFMVIICYGTLLRLASRSAMQMPVRIGVYLLIAGSILYYGRKVVLDSRELPDVVRGAITGRMRFTLAEREQYGRIQASIPAGRPLFCFLDWPLLLDHTRNPVYFPDNIGSISPPPGIPLTGRSEKLADYLRGLGLTYVASPSRSKCEVLFRSKEMSKAGMIRPTDGVVLNLWIYSLNTNDARAYKLLGELASRYPLLYDDGKSVVIDLGGPGRPDNSDVAP